MIDEQKLNLISPVKRDAVRNICHIAKDNHAIKRIIIFGSSITNTCSDHSDVDICIDADASLSGMQMYSFEEKIGPICDWNYDLLLYPKLGLRLKDQIDTKGVVVYELPS